MIRLVIGLDVGSTTEYIAKFMREDVPVTVLCYALNILVETYRKNHCRPIFAGGTAGQFGRVNGRGITVNTRSQNDESKPHGNRHDYLT